MFTQKSSLFFAVNRHTVISILNVGNKNKAMEISHGSLYYPWSGKKKQIHVYW